MWSFIISLFALFIGYALYGRFIEKIFKPDCNRVTPAYSKRDNVDFLPLPNWKVFMIQFLNIAGTGPIFGAIMGAKFGPSCYLWIVFGCIFAGAVHDYLTGMLTLRFGGLSLPNLVGAVNNGATEGLHGLVIHYLGEHAQKFLTIFMVLFMLLVGAVFVYSPALILGDIAGFFKNPSMSIMFWVLVVFVYYVIATLLPIDKVIGKVYPLFAFSLIFMAISLFVCLLIKWPTIPEFWEGLQNRGPSIGMEGQSIFPCLFITVACGAISGFHGTQSPMMARCIKNEESGRRIFYGSMILEGVVALIWAAVSSYFFFDGGMAEVGATSAQAPSVVISVSKGWLGVFGGILAMLGVVAAPITSGDTAFRSARLMVADLLGLDQQKNVNRIKVSVPLFIAAGLLLWFNIADEDGFNVVWRYFGWANQTLACVTLWTLTRFLVRNRKLSYYLVTAIPTLFMTVVCTTFICTQKIGFGMPVSWTPYVSAVALAVSMFFLVRMVRKNAGMGHHYLG